MTISTQVTTTEAVAGDIDTVQGATIALLVVPIAAPGGKGIQVEKRNLAQELGRLSELVTLMRRSSARLW